MKKYSIILVRSLLGLIFTVFGLNGFLHFIPTPPMAGLVGDMMGVYMKMGYMFPLIFGTQFVGGILVLTNVFAPLGLTLLAPVIVNILCVHLFIEPQGLGMAIFVVLAEIFLAYSYRDKFAPLFKMR